MPDTFSRGARHFFAGGPLLGGKLGIKRPTGLMFFIAIIMFNFDIGLQSLLSIKKKIFATLNSLYLGGGNASINRKRKKEARNRNS